MAEYIEREAVIALIEEKQKSLCPLGRFSRHELYGGDREKFDDWQEIIDQLAALPIADVEPVRHGQWDGESDGYAETADGEMAPVVDVWYCSECGHCIDEGIDDETLLPNYCPYCGACMDEASDAPNEETIQYNWPDTGKLEVAVKSQNMATMRFTPSEGAVRAGAEGSEHMRKICEHQRAFLAKMKELEAQGYYSGGWDKKTDKTAISKDGKIVGYMDRDLNIEWR